MEHPASDRRSAAVNVLRSTSSITTASHGPAGSSHNRANNSPSCDAIAGTMNDSVNTATGASVEIVTMTVNLNGTTDTFPLQRNEFPHPRPARTESSRDLRLTSRMASLSRQTLERLGAPVKLQES